MGWICKKKGEIRGVNEQSDPRLLLSCGGWGEGKGGEWCSDAAGGKEPLLPVYHVSKRTQSRIEPVIWEAIISVGESKARKLAQWEKIGAETVVVIWTRGKASGLTEVIGGESGIFVCIVSISETKELSLRNDCESRKKIEKTKGRTRKG